MNFWKQYLTFFKNQAFETLKKWFCMCTCCDRGVVEATGQFLKGPFIIPGTLKAMVSNLYRLQIVPYNCGNYLIHHQKLIAVPAVTCEMHITPFPKLTKVKNARMPQWDTLSWDTVLEAAQSFPFLEWDNMISLLLWLTFLLSSGRQRAIFWCLYLRAADFTDCLLKLSYA